MSTQKSKTSDQIAQYQQVSLLELLDRLLSKGVMVKGEILLSVADVDLVYLNLGLLLSSVQTVEKTARRDNREGGSMPRRVSSQGEAWDEPQLAEGSKGEAANPFPDEYSQRGDGAHKTLARTLPSAINYGAHRSRQPNTNIDPKNVEKGLAKLVLTLVELLRKLMEKQAIRRVESGALNASEIEDVGNAFLLLDEKMEELKKMFGLTDEDLNLDLGPLGELL